jgi:hypothetical protein
MMANILGLYHKTERYRVTMDSAKDNCIKVHLPDANMKFQATKTGLYVWKPTGDYIQKLPEP